MNIVRVIAVLREGGYPNENYKFVLLCGINANHQIEDGEWMGYIKNESEFHPFILRDSSCFYGDEEHNFEPTNIGDRHHLVEVGGLFTVSNQPHTDEPWQSTFEIVSCHAYQG